MKCLVRKLQATINNANLPVFEDVVLKDYITTTVDGQYIVLDDISTVRNATKVEIEYTRKKYTHVAIFGISGNLYFDNNDGYLYVYNTNKSSGVSITQDQKYKIGMDTSNGSYSVDNTTGTCSTPSTDSQSSVGTIGVFARPSQYSGSVNGAIWIHSIKITTSSNDVYNLVPAIVNGVAVLYDADRGVTYGEVNGGTLLCG